MAEPHPQRPYQAAAIEAVHDAWAADTRRTLLVMATGTGKTYTFGRILVRRRDQGYGRALVLAHRIELIDQAIAACERAGLTAEAECGDRLARPHGDLISPPSDVVVATVQTLRGKRLERWPETAFGTIVVDECFPAGTMISGRPIESINVGDVVPCVNHKTGRVTERRVTRLYRSVRQDPLVRLRYGATMIECTPNHPFFVRGKGYVEASQVAVGDMLCVWSSVFRGDASCTAKDVLEIVQSEDLFGDYGAHKSQVCGAKDARKKPNATRECARSGKRVAESDGARAEGEGRERETADESGADALGRSTVANASGGQDGDGEEQRIPELLQNRRWQRSAEDRCRDRWVKPQLPEGKSGRCEERGVLVWARVDGAETLEPPGNGGTTVYNFEVAGAHTYFANGALVHNCHHATAQSYRGILDRFPLARVLGVTATPDRGDGVGLGGVFEHVAYRYDMRDAIRDGWLCPIRVSALDAPELDVGTIRVTRQEHGRDLHAGDIAQQLDTPESLIALAIQIVEKVGTRPTVIFTPSVAMAHRLADTLAHVSHRRASAIDGMSARDDRARILAEYAAGEIQFVTNCAVLTEGWDAPHTSAVVVLRPTKSRALYAQMIGRGTRIAPNKTDCLVLDLTCNSDDHTLISPLDCLGGKPLPDAVRKLAQAAMADGDDVTQAVERAEKIANEREEARRKRREERAKTRVVAKVKYGERQIDPFREWSQRTKSDVHAMNPLARKIEKLLAAGVDVPANVTPEQCDAWAAMIAQRNAAGLCSLKQASVLRKRGLRWRDVTRSEANEILSVLAANGWRTPREIAERYRA